MILPYIGPLVVRELGDRVVPEPPRRGEPGGDPCGICTGEATGGVWSDDHWTLHPPVGGSLLGAVWLASRVHVDSFSDLPEEVAATFGGVAARVERAILSLGDVARVHLYRWGDGGSLPRVVLAAAARHARGLGDDAASLGGRAAQRPR